MAQIQTQTQKKNNNLIDNPAAVKMVSRKVMFFAKMITVAKDIGKLRVLFEDLCPTKEEKLLFIALFETMFPESELVAEYLKKWLNQRDQIKPKETEKSAQKAPTPVKKEANLAHSSSSPAPVIEFNKPLYDYNRALAADTNQRLFIRRDKKASLMKKLGNLLKNKLTSNDKKKSVTKVSKEELSAAGAGSHQNHSANKPQASSSSDAKLQRYNANVAARGAAQRQMAPSLSLGARAMGR